MINQKTIDLVKEFEGYGDKLSDGRCMAYLDRNATPANPYYDHTAGGLWTIGYGATGPEVTKGVIWTQAQADSNLSIRLQKDLDSAKKYITVPLNENQEGAVASITYNIGTGDPEEGDGCQGLYHKINKDPNNAGQYFMGYNHGHVNGVLTTMPGLTRRRAAERELYEWEVKDQVTLMSPQLQQANQVQTGLAVGGLTAGGALEYIPQVSAILHDNAGAILLGILALSFGVVYLWKRGFHIAFNDGTYVPVGTKPVPTEVVDANSAQ